MRANRKNKQAAMSKKGNGRLLLKIFAVVILLSGMYFGLRYSLHVVGQSLFPAKEIVFSGNRHLADNELKAMMGIKGNEGLIGLSGSELAARLLKSPWIRTVNLRKDFPHKLFVKIEETMPFALLEMNGRTFFIDDRGSLLEEIKSDSMPFLPIISGDPYKNRACFSEALNLVKAMKAKGFINTKDRIEVLMPNGSGAEEISMLIDGTLVKIGYGEYEDKLERLLELEDEITRRGIPVDYIDLRFANRVVVKPINEVIK